MTAGYLFSIGSDNTTTALEKNLSRRSLRDFIKHQMVCGNNCDNGRLYQYETRRQCLPILKTLHLRHWRDYRIHRHGSSGWIVPWRLKQSCFNPRKWNCFQGKGQVLLPLGGIFQTKPTFFTDGIDMDDLLSSNPDAFNSLRTFWKQSFIQLDDMENQAFKAAIIRMNETALNTSRPELFFPHAGSTDSWVHPDLIQTTQCN